MQLNKLIRKQHALTLLAKSKKCEYEQGIQLYNKALRDHTNSLQRLNTINQKINESDNYEFSNFLDRYSFSFEKYADYLDEKKQHAQAAESKLRHDVASLLDEVKNKNKIHKMVKERSTDVNRQINNFLDFHSMD